MVSLGLGDVLNELSFRNKRYRVYALKCRFVLAKMAISHFFFVRKVNKNTLQLQLLLLLLFFFQLDFFLFIGNRFLIF